MQLSNNTSKNSTIPPYLVKNERSLRIRKLECGKLVTLHLSDQLLALCELKPGVQKEGFLIRFPHTEEKNRGTNRFGTTVLIQAM